MTSKLNSHWSIALLVCLFASASVAHAVQFRVLGWTTPDTSLQFGQKPTPIVVATTHFSPEYETQGEGPLIFYKMVEKDGTPHRQTACTIALPEDLKKALIILYPGDDSTAPYRNVIPTGEGPGTPNAPLVYDYMVLDDSLEARPAGMIEFRNFSTLPVALMVDSRQLLLPPKAKAQVPIVPGAKRLSFRAAAQVNGEWKVFLTNPLPTRGQPDRMMVLLRDGPSSSAQTRGSHEPNIKMVSFSDFPPRSKTPPQGDLASIR